VGGGVAGDGEVLEVLMDVLEDLIPGNLVVGFAGNGVGVRGGDEVEVGGGDEVEVEGSVLAGDMR